MPTNTARYAPNTTASCCCSGFRPKKDLYRALSHEDALTKSKCESLETSIRKPPSSSKGFSCAWMATSCPSVNY